MATLIIDEHKKNETGGYDDVRRITNATLVKTADGSDAETKLAEAAEHIANKDNPHGATAEQVGADPAGSADNALKSAKSYADQKTVDMITAPAGGAAQMGDGIGAGPYRIEFVPDDDGAASADVISYDNKASGMAATDVQTAVDELHRVMFESIGNINAVLDAINGEVI